MKLDVGGSAAMRSYWPAYYSKAHAIAFVIDSADRRRLADVGRAAASARRRRAPRPAAPPGKQAGCAGRHPCVRDRGAAQARLDPRPLVALHRVLGADGRRDRGGASLAWESPRRHLAARRLFHQWRHQPRGWSSERLAGRASRDLGSAVRRGGDKDNEEGESNSPRGRRPRQHTQPGCGEGSRSRRRGGGGETERGDGGAERRDG